MALALWWGVGAFIKLDYEVEGIPGLRSALFLLKEFLLAWREIANLFMSTEVGRSSVRRMYQTILVSAGSMWYPERPS